MGALHRQFANDERLGEEPDSTEWHRKVLVNAEEASSLREEIVLKVV